MKTKITIIFGVGFALVVSWLAISPISDSKNNPDTVFHVTLANPDLYENGVFVDFFNIEPGNYQFRFVPNGDSPQDLEITLEGETFQFLEIFQLEGTLQKTGISEYYTWDYSGNRFLEISLAQKIKIQIDPKGNFLGPVSVDIIKQN